MNRAPKTPDLSEHALQEPRQAIYEMKRRAFQADPDNGFPRVIRKMEKSR